MLHALKTEPYFFKEIVNGNKTFDVRKNDRPFYIGDELVLQEYDPSTKKHTGEEWRGKITYILSDERFCKKGYCVLGMKETNPEDKW